MVRKVMFFPKTECKIYMKTNIWGKARTCHAAMKLLFKETLTKEAVTSVDYYSYKNHEIHFETMPILHIFQLSK